jgi:hypothetical protein
VYVKVGTGGAALPTTFVTLVCILAFKEWIELGAPKLSPWLLVETGWCIYDVADGDDIP